MDFTILFLQMLFALVVVCAGAVLLLKYVLPRISGAKKWQKNGHFELVSRFTLDYKKTLYLVRVGKKHLVLGGAEHNLTLLKEWEQSEIESLEGK
ncbi:MAG: flagellar biosynthetic protein FliO [Deltaproteobacteria bacterium]|nr:flagellar biosynthetic protein FliO [Deltaproteobacteria bacterium]